MTKCSLDEIISQLVDTIALLERKWNHGNTAEACMLQSLTAMTGKGEFRWTDECQKEFEEMSATITQQHLSHHLRDLPMVFRNSRRPIGLLLAPHHHGRSLRCWLRCCCVRAMLNLAKNWPNEAIVSVESTSEF